MKKFAVLSLVLIMMALLAVPAFAAEFSVTESTLFIYDNDDDGYFFAKVENTGETGGYCGSSVLEILNGSNEAFITKNYVSASPYGIWLEPGESVYIRESIWDKALLETPVSGFNFTPGVSNYGSKYHQVPCEAEFYFSTESKYDNEIFVTFTNNTAELMYNFEIVAALYDADDTLAYVYSSSYSNVAIHPGSTLTIMLDVNSTLSEHLNTHGIVPSRVVGMVYIED